MASHTQLAPTGYLDADHPAVRAFVAEHAGVADDPIGKATALFTAVRDRIRYSVHVDFADADGYRASATLARGRGFCVQKAVVLAATARAAGVPSRLHFVDLRNRLAPADLRAAMGTDRFAHHCFVELELGGRWWKATPSFDRETCRRQGMATVEFDGTADALLPAVRPDGRRQFEYLEDHGTFDDLPFDDVIGAFRRCYPHLDPSGTLAVEEER